MKRIFTRGNRLGNSQPDHLSCPAILLTGIFMGLLTLALVGCGTTPSPTAWSPENHSQPYISEALQPGDVLQISFPGAPDLNTTQKIRTDGKIALPLIGDDEIQIAGKTPEQAQTEILKHFASELTVPQVTVTLETSSMAVYVTGAVVNPGKIPMTRPLTDLEAVMEAGGFEPSMAKMDKVMIIRHENGQRQQFVVDLERAIKGESTNPFYLKPNDIVHVPRKGTSVVDPGF